MQSRPPNALPPRENAHCETERKSPESCSLVVPLCPIHFLAPQSSHPLKPIRQSPENAPAAPSTVRALHKNPRSLQTLAAPALPSSVHIPHAATQSRPLHAGPEP